VRLAPMEDVLEVFALLENVLEFASSEDVLIVVSSEGIWVEEPYSEVLLVRPAPPQGSEKGRREGEGPRERAREKKLECTQSCSPGECSCYKKLSDIIRFF